MKIGGLDVGRGSAVLCCLEAIPSNIKRSFKQFKADKAFLKLNTDTLGLTKFLSLGLDGIVLEPTGYWYSAFWVIAAKKHGINIYWISHTDLDKLRGSYGFTNKRDEEDSLCLAASYFDPNFVDDHDKKRYLNYYNHDLSSLVREFFHEKEQLQKLRSALIAQLRQRLAREFPEMAVATLEISKIRGFTPFIGWLAGNHLSTQIENKYKLSVVHDLDIAIGSYTKDHALTIFSLEKRITDHKSKLEYLLFNTPEFKSYNQVFNRFKLGLDCQILLLYHCYPLDKFLVGGVPWVERELNSNGKLQKRDRSLRKFQAYLGLSYSYRQSGDFKSRSFHGSSIARSHLYVWAVCVIAVNRSTDNQIVRGLRERYQELRVNVKGKDALIRILFKMTRLLFYELVRELH